MRAMLRMLAALALFAAAQGADDVHMRLDIENKLTGMQSKFKSLYVVRGSSSCWGIPGLDPLVNGSFVLTPDERNLACTNPPDYYSTLIVGFNLDFSWDALGKFEEKVGDIAFEGHSKSVGGALSWTYSCVLIGAGKPSYKITCEHAEERVFKVVIEHAASSSRHFLV